MDKSQYKKIIAVSLISGLVLSVGIVKSGVLHVSTSQSSQSQIFQIEGVEEVGEKELFFIPKSDIGRTESNRVAWNLFKKNWLTGAGLGSTLESSKKNMEYPSITNNSALLYLADTGLMGVGLILFLIYILYGFSSKRDEHDSSMKLVFWGTIAFATVFSMFHDISYQRFLWIWMGVYSGLLTSHSSISQA